MKEKSITYIHFTHGWDSLASSSSACSGLLDFGPFGILVDQEVAAHLSFPGMSSLVYSSMLLLSPQV